MTWFAKLSVRLESEFRVRQREVTTLTTRSHRIAAALLTLVLLFSATPVMADPIADKQAQAEAVQSQITALDNKAEIAIENYNVSASRYAKLTRQVNTTSKKLSRLQAKMDKLQSHIYTRADDMYREGPLGFLEVLLDAKSFDDFNTTWELLTKMNRSDANAVGELKSLKKEANALYKQLKTQQVAAGKTKRDMAANKKTVLAKLAARKQVLAGLKADIRQLIAQKQAQEAAAARARAVSSGFVLDVGGNPPSNGSKGEQAVWWAKKALGAPYVWAADGPDSFDCSGLTMWAYGHVGVSLSHSSAEQIGEGDRVSRGNLQPGDLVFFGSPIHHVGMYIGGGEMIEAPHSGAVVRIANAFRSDYVGACRPR